MNRLTKKQILQLLKNKKELINDDKNRKAFPETDYISLNKQITLLRKIVINFTLARQWGYLYSKSNHKKKICLDEFIYNKYDELFIFFEDVDIDYLTWLLEEK